MRLGNLLSEEIVSPCNSRKVVVFVTGEDVSAAAAADIGVRIHVQTTQGVRVEHAVIAAILNPRFIVHAHDVRGRIIRKRESRVRQESPGDGVRGQFVRIRTFESDDRFHFVVAVGN